jgi:hypothetical protein
MTDTQRLRTRLAAGSMVAGGLLLLGMPLGGASGGETTRQQLEVASAHPVATAGHSLLLQAAVLLVLPGVAAVVGLVPPGGRGSRLVVSAGVVYGAGLVGAFAFAVMSGLDAAMAGPGPVDDAVVAAVDRTAASPVAAPTFVLALLCFHQVGLPWLAVGMVRADMLHPSVAVAATLGTGAAFFGSGTPLEGVGWVVVGLAIATMGARMLLGVPSDAVAPDQTDARERPSRREGPAAPGRVPRPL